MRDIKIILLTLFSLIGMTCGENTGSNLSNTGTKFPVPPLPTATVDELASGKNVFETDCAVCHKTDGTGGTVTIEGKNLDVENLRSNKIKRFSDEKIIG